MRHTFPALCALFAMAPLSHAELKQLKPGWNLFTPQQDVQLGREAQAKINESKPLVHDARLEDYVTRIGHILMRSPHAGNWPYEFHIINDKNINAFSLPGGFVYINLGAIDACDNEAQLAGVLAHEMSHVNLRHGTNQVTKAAAIELPAMLAASLFGRNMLGQLARIGVDLTASSVLLKFSRANEAEADYNGVEIMADAGYNPLELASFFEKLESKQERGLAGSVAQFLSDHPNPGNRVQAIEDEVREVPRKHYVTSITGQFPKMKTLAMRIPPPPKGRPEAALAHPFSAPRPSSRFERYDGNSFALDYPSNWRASADQASGIVTIAPPEGMVSSGGGTAVGYGIEIGYFSPPTGSGGLRRDTQALIQQLAASNPDLRSQPGDEADIGGGRGLLTTLRNRSPFANETEIDRLATTVRPEGLFYLIFITPQNEAERSRAVFDRIINSVRFP